MAFYQIFIYFQNVRISVPVMKMMTCRMMLFQLLVFLPLRLYTYTCINISDLTIC